MRVGRTVTRTQLGRYVAALAGLLAFLFYYQPWVAASLPGHGESELRGVDLARGEAARRVEAAGGGAAASGLILPTRIATVAPGIGSRAGALPMPTRIPTVAGAPVSGDASGIVLPTRQPSGAVIATQAAATAIAVRTAQASGVRATPAAAAAAAPRSERLPGLVLYGVPLAAAGIVIFSITWGRLNEPRDRLYAQLWTSMLAVSGVLGVGYVLLKVATALRPNNLLAPGEVHAPLWGLWSAFAAFVVSLAALAAAWLRPPDSSPLPLRERDRG